MTVPNQYLPSLDPDPVFVLRVSSPQSIDSIPDLHSLFAALKSWSHRTFPQGSTDGSSHTSQLATPRQPEIPGVWTVRWGWGMHRPNKRSGSHHRMPRILVTQTCAWLVAHMVWALWLPSTFYYSGLTLAASVNCKATNFCLFHIVAIHKTKVVF